MKTSNKLNSRSLWVTMIVLTALVTGCRDNDNDKINDFVTPDSTPTVVSSNVANSATDIAVNSQITATFSEAMDPLTLDNTSFTVKADNEAAITATVSLDDASNTAIFTPTSNFTASTLYTATLTTAVKSALGISLANDHVWTFTTAATPDITPPTVTLTSPVDGAMDFPLNRNLVVDFSEALDPSTVSDTSFVVTDGTTPVAGTVLYSGTTVTFDPTSDLTAQTVYTATLTTDITDLAEPGNPLANVVVWSFTTGAVAAEGPAPVALRTAGDFVILSKTGTTNIPTSTITGNLGASPITAAAMDNVTCTEITGTIYGSDAAYTGSGDVTCFAGTAPDNTLVANAVLDMGTAYNDAAGRSLPDFTELHAGDISGQTLDPGLYKWSSDVLISTDVTLSGAANDVWIFQIAGNVTQADASSIILADGAQAKNVFWQVGGVTGVAIGTDAHFAGIILAEKAITVNTSSSVDGRLFAHTAVTLDQNAVTEPAE